VTAGSGVNPPPVTPYQGLDHFGLQVNDIDKVVADLKSKARVHHGAETGAAGLAHLFRWRGPRGVSIEVLERKPA